MFSEGGGGGGADVHRTLTPNDQTPGADQLGVAGGGADVLREPRDRDVRPPL